MISIPSIFYGNRIEPGSIIKWYFTGSLVAELQDTKQNGELIEVTGDNVDAVAGVVLYDEGFILLTGSWALNGESIPWYRFWNWRISKMDLLWCWSK